MLSCPAPVGKRYGIQAFQRSIMGFQCVLIARWKDSIHVQFLYNSSQSWVKSSIHHSKEVCMASIIKSGIKDTSFMLLCLIIEWRKTIGFGIQMAS